MPFSMRQPVENLSDVKMINDFAALPIKMEIKQTLEESLPVFRKKFHDMKSSLSPFGIQYVFGVCQTLPFTLPKVSMNVLSDKFTMIYSNLNAAKQAFNFNGHKFISCFYFVPAVGKLCCGVSIITVGESMQLACFSDECSIKDPDTIVKLFQEKNNKVLDAFKK